MMLPMLFGSTLISDCYRNKSYNQLDAQFYSNDSLVLWKQEIKLTWDDFQGIPDSSSIYKAMTSVDMRFEPLQSDKDSVIYSMKVVFESHNSWVKDANKTAKLLKHEQIHFDISELVIRSVRKRFSELQFTTIAALVPVLNKIFDEAYLQRRIYNNKYDTETAHSTIEKKQKEWELKIAKELKALDKYSATRVVLKRVKK